MTETGKIEIYLSKQKLITRLIASIILVLLGLWILIYQPVFNDELLNNPLLKFGGATASISFFSVAIFYYSKKLKDNKPGIIIDHTGVYDNSNTDSVGCIPWTDITNIVIAKVMKQEFLMIIVHNPDDYINKQTNILKRKGLVYNLETYGSPIAISTNDLKYNIGELKKLITNELVDFKNKPGQHGPEN